MLPKGRGVEYRKEEQARVPRPKSRHGHNGKQDIAGASREPVALNSDDFTCID